VRIQEFKNIEEEAEFWDTHDTSEMDLGPVDIIFVRKTPMVSISLRIPNEDLERIKKLAKRHGIPYTTLIRNMIKRELGFLEKQEVGSHCIKIVDILDKIVQSNLKATTKMALLYLLIKEGKGTFKTSIRKVQKQTGLSLSSVKRMFSELKEAGIVERQNSEGSVFKLDTWVQNEHT